MKSTHRFPFIAATIAIGIASAPAAAQSILSGRVLAPRFAGSNDRVPMTGVLAFASLPGGGSEPLSFRTWETEPVGWYRLAGSAGNYTIVWTNPASFMRPIVRTNQLAFAGEKFDRIVSPSHDIATFVDSSWDDKPATNYWQSFTARGTSVTSVGFRLAHDGVDGFGPGKQNLLVSIHKQTTGTPDTWPQVGPTIPVLDVDSGGGKNYIWSAGWNSGEVPLTPGATYAVQIRGEKPGAMFQAFWRQDNDRASDCFRKGEKGLQGFCGRDLWMAVATDSDGLTIPYNKRVHRQFNDLTSCIKKWSQTYIPRGRGLASVVLYAAVSGAQPPLSRQRVVVRVREGGPSGRVVGVEKIAIGNGNYTGDASWGTFGLTYAPGEVSLVPGKPYAIEWESIETYETLHGFINIKGEVSNDKPGFNPYKKHRLDEYAGGTAYRNGTEAVDFDLDMQVIEYEHAATGDWSREVAGDNLVVNGDMQAGDLNDKDASSGTPNGWTPFTSIAGTVHQYLTDGAAPTNRILRVAAPVKPAPIDGGFVQRVEKLDRLETYRLAGRVRASWPLDDKRQLLVGIDPTGQTADAAASTIRWTTFPKLYGVFVDAALDPVRPEKDSVSIWLRARCADTPQWPYKADFDDFALRRVRTDVPGRVDRKQP